MELQARGAAATSHAVVHVGMNREDQAKTAPPVATVNVSNWV